MFALTSRMSYIETREAMKHLGLVMLITVLIILGIFLPYIPGDYDCLAIVLSGVFQFAAFASLPLVPIGLIWCFIEIVKGRRIDDAVKNRIRKVYFGVTVMIILAAALGAFASNSRFTSIIILVIGFFVFSKIGRKGKEVAYVESGRYSLTPYYLIFIPLIVLVVRISFLEKVKANATNFVIKQGEQLIQDIEAYKKANSHYPISLQSTIEDYKPSVSGIRRFHYEPNGSAYNLYFEQFSDMLGTEEIVMYNGLDEHEMTVHNQDLLRISPENILRGYHAVETLTTPHWKIFYFD